LIVDLLEFQFTLGSSWLAWSAARQHPRLLGSATCVGMRDIRFRVHRDRLGYETRIDNQGRQMPPSAALFHSMTQFLTR